MIMGTVNCLCTFPGLFLMDRIGRRRLLLWGAVVQLVSHFLVGIIHVATGGKAPIWTAVFSGTFIAAFAATWGPCAWVITSELFGLKTRAKQMSFAVAGNWYKRPILVRWGLISRGFNTLLGQISPMMSGDADHPVLGVNVAFVWGALNVGCWAYVYFFIPELKGLDLEQVDELYLSSSPLSNTTM
jgi:MFS family permease